MVTLGDIQHLQFRDLRSKFEDFSAGLECLGIDWPEDPARRVLYEHGNKHHIAELYGHLDLAAIRWNLRTVATDELVSAAVPWDEGQLAVLENAEKVDYWIDVYRRADGADAWTDTWRVAPYFIDGQLLRPPVNRIALVEGHSRMGNLIGCHQRADLPLRPAHEIWFASRA